MEMAQAHRRLGCDVTVIEAFKIMGRDHPALTTMLKDSLTEEGITLIENCGVESVSKKAQR